MLIQRQRSNRIDEILKASFSAMVGLSTEPFALYATGGYGREEIFPNSDLDLMLLVENADVWEKNTALQDWIQANWTSDLDVRVALRTLDGVETDIANHIHTYTSLLDRRLLVENSNLASLLETKLSAFLPKLSRTEYLKERLTERSLRKTKFIHASALQEPEIKNGPGGLRDLQHISWFGSIFYSAPNINQLQHIDKLKNYEVEGLNRASRFIFAVREELHTLSNKDVNTLSTTLQLKVATNMGYSQATPEERVTEFMRDLFWHMHIVEKTLEMLTQRVITDLQLTPQKASIIHPHFKVVGGQIVAHEEVTLTLEHIPELFRLLSDYSFSFSQPIREFILENRMEVVNNPRLRQLLLYEFRNTLKQPGKLYQSLTEWMDLSVLPALFPVFATIRFQVQMEHYHIYTLWEHTLQSLKHLDTLVTTDDSELTQHLFQPYVSDLLPAALLLHDIGKSIQNANHAALGVPIARGILEECYFPADDIERICLLVNEHLSMARFWQSHDLDDMPRVEAFARQIGDRKQQTLLYLLTICDANATNPTLWNGYKYSLHSSLFARMGAPHSLEIINPFQEAIDVSILAKPDTLFWNVTLTQPISQNLLHQVAGMFTSLGCSIHAVQTHVQGNWSRDTYTVSVPSYTQPAVLEGKIKSAIESNYTNIATKVDEQLKRVSTRVYSQDHRPFPSNVTINEENDRHVISIQTKDRPGLLYHLTKVLAEMNCTITFVKVYTEAGWANDTFYIAKHPDVKTLRNNLKALLTQTP